MKTVAVHLLLVCCLVFQAVAQQAQPAGGDDPELEKRVTKLAQELRCLVCQNETLADSRADLAVDLRNQVREQMRAGKTDKEIIAYLTDRYGDFVLYRPPMKPTTYLLWFGPFLLLLGGLLFLFRYVRQRGELIPDQPISAADRRRAEELLKSGTGKEVA
jgi:cytochrome c-type biogenesis protein CcmH